MFHFTRPSLQSFACAAASSSTDRPLRRADSGSTQGVKSPGSRSGKTSSRFVTSPLGVEQEEGHVREKKLFQEADTEAGLAAAGHTDADGVRDQVLAVVKNWLG